MRRGARAAPLRAKNKGRVEGTDSFYSRVMLYLVGRLKYLAYLLEIFEIKGLAIYPPARRARRGGEHHGDPARSDCRLLRLPQHCRSWLL